MSVREEIRALARSTDSRFACAAAVESVGLISSHFYRVVVRGDGLADYRTALPADAFRLVLPPEGHRQVEIPAPDELGRVVWPAHETAPLQRAYTVRRFDPDTRKLTFDIAVHQGGPAMIWLDQAQVGDVVGLIGIRHDFVAAEGIERHLLIADASAVPAVAGILETLAPTVTGVAFLQVEGEDDRKLVPHHPGVEVHWTIAPPCSGPNSALEVAVRSFARTCSRTQGWIAGEAGAVRSLRRHVMEQWGVDRDDLHAVAYWKAGQSGDQRDAASAEKYQQAARNGLDITDPAVVADMEFA